MTTIIPPAVGRRLILALLGYRYQGDLWAGPSGPLFTDEQLDTMSERRWRAFVRCWLTSAAPTN
jgi:hypothetical protein